MNIGKIICHPYFNHWVCSHTQLNGRTGQYCNFSSHDITIYRGFTKACGLTVLLGCFRFFHWFSFASIRRLSSVV